LPVTVIVAADAGALSANSAAHASAAIPDFRMNTS
jgi:hypothetical protein